jgi:hypothetical protein
MNDQPNPAFDAVHPSGAILFRSCRGGFMHSVALSEQVMDTDASSLAEGILRTASVSFLKSAMEIRSEVVAAQPDMGAQALPTGQDLDEAIVALNAHTLTFREH